MSRLKPHEEILKRLDSVGANYTDRNIVMMCRETLEDMHEEGHSYSKSAWEQETGESLKVWHELKKSCQRILRSKTAKKYIDDEGDWD